MKTFLPIILFTVLLFSCETEPDLVSGCTDQNSFNYDSSAETDNGSCKSMAGCLGYTPGFSNSGTKGVTLGDPYWDQKTNEEVIIQRQFWGDYLTSVWILYEPNGTINAWADSRGEILFGRNMFYHILNTHGNSLPSAGVLAHEFAHRAQQNLGFVYSKPEYKELEADAFSGFYMALVKNHPWSNINSFFLNTYLSGDTNFNTENHHGTHNERLESARFGFEIALEVLGNGIQYSYNELHLIFSYEIENRIAPRSSNNVLEFEEIPYPLNLTEEYIKSLYPKFD